MIALATTSGIRYILAGFCDYVDDDGFVSHQSFQSLYAADHDGYAGRDGFQTGDIIRAIETCEHEIDHLGNVVISEQMIAVDGMSDDAWKIHATSCETLRPGSDINFIVERNPTVK
jgi:hypothetical protein